MGGGVVEGVWAPAVNPGVRSSRGDATSANRILMEGYLPGEIFR
jgi:hypothetical protein